jgi:hypothetical protein
MLGGLKQDGPRQRVVESAGRSGSFDFIDIYQGPHVFILGKKQTK